MVTPHVYTPPPPPFLVKFFRPPISINFEEVEPPFPYEGGDGGGEGEFKLWSLRRARLHSHGVNYYISCLTRNPREPQDVVESLVNVT